MIRTAIAVFAAIALLVATGRGASASGDIDTAVAAALVERADQLFARGDYRNAKTLYIEAIERDPAGEHASAALEGLRKSNKRLGVYDRDDGRPSPGGSKDDAAVLDPYGEPSAGGDGAAGGPLDPYANVGTRDADGRVLDPYAEEPADASPDPSGDPAGEPGGSGDGLAVTDPYAEPGEGANPDGPAETPGPEDGPPDDAPADGADEPATARGPRRELQAAGGAFGLFAGLTLGGGDGTGAVILGLGGLALGGWGAGRVADRYELSSQQVQLINSGLVWGTSTGAFFGHLISGTDTTGGELFVPGTLGGALGAGAGVLLSKRSSASAGDIATVNSLGGYGLTFGLMTGVALDVFDDRAYAINALVGTAAGLAGGVALARRTEFSRRRTLWVDAGAAAGLATPWVLLYPLIAGDGNADLQVTAVTSLFTAAGGAALAYYLTRDLDAAGDADGDDDSGSLAAVRRTNDGRWLWRLPAPMPMGDPALAPQTGLSVGLGLAGGRF